MFQKYLQRLMQVRAETPCFMACEEIKLLISYIEEQEYDRAIEFMIFESHFDPCTAVKYLVKHSSDACCFAKLEEAYLSYVKSEKAIEFFSDRLTGECELKDRVDQLATLLYEAALVHA